MSNIRSLSRPASALTTARHWTKLPGELLELLRGTNSRRQTVSVLTTGFHWLLAALVSLLITILLDAAFAFPVWLRCTVWLLGIAAGLALPLLTVIAVVRLRFNPSQVARWIEQRTAASDNVLASAVEFQLAPPAGSSAALRERVVELAAGRVSSLRNTPLVSWRPLSRPIKRVLLMLLLIGILCLLMPRLFSMVVPRLLLPLADLPPYSLYEFQVEVTPKVVDYGQPATAIVSISGWEPVQEASLVICRGDEKSAVLLTRRPEGLVHRWDAVTEPIQFYIQTAGGRSAMQELIPRRVPRLVSARVQLKPPSYTGWKTSEQQLGPLGIRGLAGTEVLVTVEGSLPLGLTQLKLLPPRQARGAVATKSPSDTAALSTPTDVTDQAAPEESAVQEVLLEPLKETPQIAQGRFTLKRGGFFEVQLTSAEGQRSEDRLSGPIQAFQDRPPEVQISTPSQRTVATPTWKVPIRVTARDDVAIQRWQVVRQVNGWPAAPVTLPWTAPVSRLKHTWNFDLTLLGAEPGDRISFYVTAFDGAQPEPHCTDSATHVIEVISEEDYLLMARQQYRMDEMEREFETIRKDMESLEKRRDQLLEELQHLQEQLKQQEQAGLEAPSQAARIAAQRLRRQAKQFAEQSAQLAEELAERAAEQQLYEAEQPYQEMLQRLSKQLESQQRMAQRVSDGLRNTVEQETLDFEWSALSEFQTAAEELAQQKEPFDEGSEQERAAAAEDLKQLRQADELQGQADRLQSLTRQQRELAEKLAQYAAQPEVDSAEQSRLNKLAERQSVLANELKDVTEQLRAAAKESAESLPQMSTDAQRLADAIEQSGAMEQQQSAAQTAQEGKGQQSHQHARSAAEKLESLAQECEECQSSGQCVAGSIDGPLRMSRAGAQRQNRQMAQGRPVPGQGKGKGKGSGQGTGEGEGEGEGEGQGSGRGEGQSGQGGAEPQWWRPGQTMPEGSDPVTLAGPRSNREPRQPNLSDSGNANRGTGLGDRNDDGANPEVLTPDQSHTPGSMVETLRSTPARYRQEAEAYFRRLSEEAANRGRPSPDNRP